MTIIDTEMLWRQFGAVIDMLERVLKVILRLLFAEESHARWPN